VNNLIKKSRVDAEAGAIFPLFRKKKPPVLDEHVAAEIPGTIQRAVN
jgi:hypothetical protein